MTLWPDLRARYPVRGDQWRRKLELLNAARNGIAHDDETKIAKVRSSGWPLTLPTIRRGQSALDGLAAGMTM